MKGQKEEEEIRIINKQQHKSTNTPCICNTKINILFVLFILQSSLHYKRVDYIRR